SDLFDGARRNREPVVAKSDAVPGLSLDVVVTRLTRSFARLTAAGTRGRLGRTVGFAGALPVCRARGSECDGTSNCIRARPIPSVELLTAHGWRETRRRARFVDYQAAAFDGLSPRRVLRSPSRDGEKVRCTRVGRLENSPMSDQIVVADRTFEDGIAA